jgi:hypothetical protein
MQNTTSVLPDTVRFRLELPVQPTELPHFVKICNVRSVQRAFMAKAGESGSETSRSLNRAGLLWQI